jgi:quercetin dioxygenase-like cupin family protein
MSETVDPKKKAAVSSREGAEPIELPGRTARILFSTNRFAAETLTLIDVELAPGGATTPAHRHVYFEEAIYVHSGSARAWVEGQVYPLKAGEAVLIPTGHRHMIRNAGAEPLRLLTFFGDRDYRRGFVESPEIHHTDY